MDCVQVNVAVVCGYLCECFRVVYRGEEEMNAYGIYTG